MRDSQQAHQAAQARGAYGQRAPVSGWLLAARRRSLRRYALLGLVVLLEVAFLATVYFLSDDFFPN
jgi:hypothetical protein